MRKTYTKEFKLTVCQKINRKEESVSSISKEYGISRPIVSRWVSEYNRYKNKAFRGHGNKLPESANVHALKRQNEQLKLENEILKKLERFVEQEKN